MQNIVDGDIEPSLFEAMDDYVLTQRLAVSIFLAEMRKSQDNFLALVRGTVAQNGR